MLSSSLLRDVPVLLYVSWAKTVTKFWYTDRKWQKARLFSPKLLLMIVEVPFAALKVALMLKTRPRLAPTYLSVGGR